MVYNGSAYFLTNSKKVLLPDCVGPSRRMLYIGVSTGGSMIMVDQSWRGRRQWLSKVQVTVLYTNTALSLAGHTRGSVLAKLLCWQNSCVGITPMLSLAPVVDVHFFLVCRRKQWFGESLGWDLASWTWEGLGAFVWVRRIGWERDREKNQGSSPFGCRESG